MGAEKIISKILLEKIIKYSPIIVETASKIYDTVKKRWFSPVELKNNKSINNDSIELSDIVNRVSELEKNEIEQADLIQKIAVQLNDMSMGLKFLSKRIMIAIIISGVSMLLSIILFILYLVK